MSITDDLAEQKVQEAINNVNLTGYLDLVKTLIIRNITVFPGMKELLLMRILMHHLISG